MKKLVATLVLAIAGNGVVFAQTNFYTNVTNLWEEGYKTNVLAIANARLAVSSNDIAGLILKAGYYFSFLEDSSISNAYLRVLQVGDTIMTTNFVSEYQGSSRESILWLLDDLAENPMTEQEIQAEKHKAFIKYKPLPHGKMIDALQKDGYFD